MIDAHSHAVLVDLIRRQGRSLLQYIRDCYPWTTPAEHQALERIQRVIQKEEDSVFGLLRFLRQRKVSPPYLGVYPGSFTTINFVSLKHLEPLLVDYERRGIADLEKQLPKIPDPEVRRLLDDVLALKRRHLGELTRLHQPAAPVLSPAATH